MTRNLGVTPFPEAGTHNSGLSDMRGATLGNAQGSHYKNSNTSRVFWQKRHILGTKEDKNGGSDVLDAPSLINANDGDAARTPFTDAL